MADLIERLKKEIDRDENMARYSGGTGRWSVGDCIDAPEDLGTTEWQIVEGQYCHSRVRGNTRANHVARHDPQRILRQAAAYRRVLQRHQPAPQWSAHQPPQLVIIECSHCKGDGSEPGMYDNHPVALPWPCEEIRDLAAVYGIEIGDVPLWPSNEVIAAILGKVEP